MLKKIFVIAGVVLIAAAAALLYMPIRILAFHVMEPKFICPVDTDQAKIRSDGWGDGNFGAKRNGGRLHLGIDLQAPIGTPVRAAKSGLAISNSNAGMGKYVVIKHIDGTKTIYGHLSKMFVDSRGEKVKMGDIVGEVGRTGNARNPCILPHLHFELWVDNEPIDPLAGYMKLK